MGIYMRDGVIHRDLVFTIENIGHKIVNKNIRRNKEKQLCGLIESKNNKTRYPSPKKKKGNQRCTEAVHQTGAVTLDLSHFLQQLIEVFLNDDSCGMGITQSLPGTIYGFAIE